MRKLAKGEKIGPYPYRIIKQLGEGEGAMSVIYLASIGARENQQVVLKIANVGTQHERFYHQTLANEVEHLRKLNHTGIVRLHNIQVRMPRPIYSARASALPNKPWFSVMEYLAGGSLRKLIDNKRLDVGLALRIAYPLAKTVEYIHRQGYVHLDIKPENVVFRKPLSRDTIDPVLVDFGIARAIAQPVLEAMAYRWVPPERIESETQAPEKRAKAYPAMDVYALGLMLYRMLTGRLPFQGSRQSITDAILRGNPTAPSTYESSLNRELDQLVLWAMAKEPHNRPTAAGWAKRLEKLLHRPEYRDYEIPQDKGLLKRFTQIWPKFFTKS